MENGSLVELYSRDRRKLMQFLFASGLIKQVPTPSGVDLDMFSVDYIIDTIKSGGLFDISVATKKYHEAFAYPIMIHSQSEHFYFLHSDTNSAGSPPRRVPPRINSKSTVNYASHSSTQSNPQVVEKLVKYGTTNEFKLKASNATSLDPKISPLGLPNLNTGLSDDDLRESAYEILIASIIFSRTEVHAVEDRKKENISKVLSGFKSKRKIHLQPFSDKNAELIKIIRVQMQISETADACIRKRLLQLAPRRMSRQIDVPEILLGLLDGISKSDFPTEKSYIQWKNRQANILEEFLCFPENIMTRQHLVRSSLAKIRDLQQWDIIMSPSERREILISIGQVASMLSSLSGQFGIQDETYYWTSGYHLNIRLYEKLLFGLFDILDEGELIVEANEILLLTKLTWSTLGITQKMHNAIYGWVLFKQYVETDKTTLLEHTTFELQKILSDEAGVGKEGKYMNSLVCSRQCNGIKIDCPLMLSISVSISVWYDTKLQDYHHYFSEKLSDFQRVMTLVSVVGILSFDEWGEVKLMNLNTTNDNATIKVRAYVEKSAEAACTQVENTICLESKEKKMHPLTLLANELKLVAEREFNVFFPVLCHWCPESGMITAKLLHQFYGERLKLFLQEVSCLSEDVRSVLQAAYMLDVELTHRYTSTAAEHQISFHQYLEHYQIDEVSGPIILDWVIAQHAHVLEWTGRAFDLEDWEPLSYQQKQVASIVEVFRIIEETVDQFFGLNLPLDITHLQALLSVIFHGLDAYLLKVSNQLVEKDHLYPLAPPLTRYEETVIPIIKKNFLECIVLEDHMHRMLTELTVSKLCIRLNTLQYILKQISLLEEGIRKSWARMRRYANERIAEEEYLPSSGRETLTHSEAVNELFCTSFSSINQNATGAINKICGFLGARVVFWDLRDTFLYSLYRGNVEGARLDSALPHIDMVLDRICCLVDDSLRDLVVLSILRASLEGYAWILLDGGPSRAFSESDITIMGDDLNMLKEFFVANGEGLPRSVVQQEAKFSEKILHLYSLESDIVIQMLMNASEHISAQLDSCKRDGMCLEQAHTLIRVLCHKKDREASKFLKRQYQFPTCSEYDDTPAKDPTLRSPLMSDLIKRSTSFRWTNNGQSSFKSIKKKLQEATSEIRYVASEIRNVAW